MPDFWSIFDFFSKKRQEKALREEDDRESFIQRYKAFREVLKNNNEVLLTMGDMQEKASGAFVFDRAYVRSSYQSVAQGVKRIIDNLNILSDEKYRDLIIPYNEIDGAVRGLLFGRVEIPVTDYVLPLKALGKESAITAGGKFAFLGELANALKIPIPPGFVITTYAYQAFILHNKIQHVLTDRIKGLDIRKYEALQTASREIQELVRESEIPQEIETRIWDAYRAMGEETRQADLKVSVRSSAIHEDILASFAGQYESALNVSEGELLEQYKRVLASQFTPRALFYYVDKGFAIEEMAMAVGVLAMVEAKASGILYSRDPGNPDEDVVLINAVCGLGSYAVGGKVPTDNYRVSGKGSQKITRETGEAQDVMLIPDRDGGTREVPVPEDVSGKPCLDERSALQLAVYARRTEDHFRQPQDMEWAMDSEGQLYLLQARPLRLSSSRPLTERSRSTAVKGHRMLLDKGIIACRGVGAGPVCIIRNEEDMLRFPEGGVMVVRHTYPEFAAVLKKAAAVISDIGSVLGHLATVVREYNVPAIFNTEKATRVLTDGMEVTVDAVYASVYEGVVEELLKERGMRNDFEGSPILKQLREVLDKITPLNLTDPRGPGFRAMGCKTFHDITRFAHEVSLRAIFNLSKESHFAERSTKQLVSGVPLKWWVIDLEDGLAPGIKGKKVTPEEIASIPMRVLWEGMTALPWKGPPPVDAKGFMSVMLSSTTDPSIDPAVGRRFADKNYIIVSKHFCNVSTRLGFHFSTIEAYLGDQENQNYIGFVYTGGGADPGRKRRRAALITKILEKFDFRVEKREDTIFARIEGHKQDFLEERMKMLGHVIVHTRQMDMVMYNDALVDWYYKELLKGLKTFIDIPE